MRGNFVMQRRGRDFYAEVDITTSRGWFFWRKEETKRVKLFRKYGGEWKLENGEPAPWANELEFEWRKR